MITEYQALPKILRFERMPVSKYSAKYNYHILFRGDFPKSCDRMEEKLKKQYQEDVQQP